MRAYLDLVRVFLTATAPADSWTGYFIASSVSGSALTFADVDLTQLGALAALSISAYWFGMVTNDLFDLERDRRRSMDRPLANASIRPAKAWILAGLLLGVITTLSWTLSLWAESGLLVAAILSYNAGGKRLPVIGNLLMGICRSLNLLLGYAAADEIALGELFGTGAALGAAGLLGLYIAGVTSISLLEDRPYRKRRLAVALGALLVVPATLALWNWRQPGAWFNAAALTWYLARGLRLPDERTGLRPHPADGVVRRGLGALFLVDAGLLWGHGLAVPALVIYGLGACGWIFKKWWFRKPTA